MTGTQLTLMCVAIKVVKEESILANGNGGCESLCQWQRHYAAPVAKLLNRSGWDRHRHRPGSSGTVHLQGARASTLRSVLHKHIFYNAERQDFATF